MKVRVLGSGAGGGLPQWNCGGSYSVRARRGDADVPPRNQASIAVSPDGDRWSLVNASPDIRQQLAAFPGLHPRPGTRDIPLDTVVLTNADLDHTIGLLVMRESLPYRIRSTPWVRDAILANNAAWRLMEPAWQVARLDEPFPLDRGERLEARLFPLAGKVPPYLDGIVANHASATAGVRITDRTTGARLVYAPGIKSYDSATRAELEQADCRIVDGTFFEANELLAMRPGAVDAHAMGHLPVGGADGSLEILAKMPGRSLYIHLNNTNPLLDAGSEQVAEVASRGVEIAHDAMEIEL